MDQSDQPEQSGQPDQWVRHPLRAFALTPVLVAPIYFLILGWGGFELPDSLMGFVKASALFVLILQVYVIVIGLYMLVFAVPLYFCSAR